MELEKGTHPNYKLAPSTAGAIRITVQNTDSRQKQRGILGFNTNPIKIFFLTVMWHFLLSVLIGSCAQISIFKDTKADSTGLMVELDKYQRMSMLSAFTLFFSSPVYGFLHSYIMHKRTKNILVELVKPLVFIFIFVFLYGITYTTILGTFFTYNMAQSHFYTST
ncbi:hypothetical protein NEFER03_1832 [Nematocida sp. LUAm3]|nr:hypothetical protein NEFER03_1832 [Nematocida sp. LUAm3]KAI5173861.1 hypothetical protein NEFER02_0328 [Nematocida sp. LUAm2]KAI5177394.1 hypothetical protein NEFER01_0669 [Nematocida sp. LUAm1]